MASLAPEFSEPFPIASFGMLGRGSSNFEGQGPTLTTMAKAAGARLRCGPWPVGALHDMRVSSIKY